jgi:hypothetical protein
VAPLMIAGTPAPIGDGPARRRPWRTEPSGPGPLAEVSLSDHRIELHCKRQVEVADVDSVRPTPRRFAIGAIRPVPCERVEVAVTRVLVEAYTR